MGSLFQDESVEISILDHFFTKGSVLSVNEVALSSTPEPALLHRDLNELPHEVISGSGLNLLLASGQTIIDSCGGAAVAVLGHGNDEVGVAAMKQMMKVSYVHTGAYTTSSAEDLAHIILDGNPHGLEKALFVQSGKSSSSSAHFHLD